MDDCSKQDSYIESLYPQFNFSDNILRPKFVEIISFGSDNHCILVTRRSFLGKKISKVDILLASFYLS